jgi:hypothetical protein
VPGELVNATGHEICVLDEHGTVVGRLAPSAHLARVEVTRRVVATVYVAGRPVAVHAIAGTRVSGLPPAREGVYCVVSRWTADAVARAGRSRRDLLVVDEVERRPDGSIAGCRSFSVV